MISTGSLVLLLNRTTATLPFDKGRDQTSKPFLLNCKKGIRFKAELVTVQNYFFNLVQQIKEFHG